MSACLSALCHSDKSATDTVVPAAVARTVQPRSPGPVLSGFDWRIRSSAVSGGFSSGCMRPGFRRNHRGATIPSFTPRAWKIIRERWSEGLSLGMFALTTLAFISWTTFGILKGEWTLIVPKAICLVLAVFIPLMIALPLRKTREVAKQLDRPC
jgi:MtN3 and saliva related transmembrane protein